MGVVSIIHCVFTELGFPAQQKNFTAPMLPCAMPLLSCHVIAHMSCHCSHVTPLLACHAIAHMSRHSSHVTPFLACHAIACMSRHCSHVTPLLACQALLDMLSSDTLGANSKMRNLEISAKNLGNNFIYMYVLG